jgi:uncharacterized phiE125 gp8 family phage protein
MPLVQTSAPSIEPVTLSDAKLHLRVIDTAEDTLITLLIGAARRYAEMYCNRSFVTQGWRLTLDAFPGPSLMGVPYGRPYTVPAHAVQLERTPVLGVSAITYQDMGGTWQTMSASDYVVDATGPIGRITPVFGKIWPVTLPQIAAVRIDYTAGYGPAATDVPEGIRQWLLLRIGTLYENREEVAAMNRGSITPLPFVDQLLDPYRVHLN